MAKLHNHLVKLRRVQRYVERGPDDLLGQRIVEGHGPRHVGFAAPATASGEATDAAERVSQRQSWRKDVAGPQHGQIVAAHVPDAHDQCEHKAARPHATRLEGREAEDLSRVFAIVSEIHEDHQDLRANNAGENRNDAKVPKLVGIESLLATELDDKHEAKDQAQGGHQSVGGQAKIANVK